MVINAALIRKHASSDGLLHLLTGFEQTPGIGDGIKDSVQWHVGIWTWIGCHRLILLHPLCRLMTLPAEDALCFNSELES